MAVGRTDIHRFAEDHSVSQSATPFGEDAPGPFSPVEDWRAFLAELRKLASSPQVAEAIDEAERHIRAVEAEEAANQGDD